MEYFLAVMAMVYDLFNIPLNIYGFEFSLWQILIFGLLISVVFVFVGRMIHGD